MSIQTRESLVRNQLLDQCIDMISSMHKQRKLLVIFSVAFYMAIAICAVSIAVASGAGVIVGLCGALVLAATHALLSLHVVGSDEVGVVLFFGAPAWQCDSGMVFAPLFLSKLITQKKSFFQVLFGAPFRDENGTEIDPRGNHEQTNARTFVYVDPSLKVNFDKPKQSTTENKPTKEEARSEAQAAFPHFMARYYIELDPLKNFRDDEGNTLEDAFTTQAAQQGKHGLTPEPCGFAIFVSVANNISEVNESIKEVAVAALANWAGSKSIVFALRNYEEIKTILTRAVEESVGEVPFPHEAGVNRWWGINIEVVRLIDIGLSPSLLKALAEAAAAVAEKETKRRGGEGEAAAIEALAKQLNGQAGMTAYQWKKVVEALQHGNNNLSIYGADVQAVAQALIGKAHPS